MTILVTGSEAAQGEWNVPPNISVLTTLFDHERFIKAALESALAQTLPPAEIIVFDDASTDLSLDAAHSVSHPAIRVFSSSCNLGGANTVEALNACGGKFIAILNSDDIWLPEKLERQYDWLADSPRTGAVFTHVTTIDEAGNPRKPRQQPFAFHNRSRHEWLRHFFLAGNPFCASSALVRKECFERLGPLNGSFIQLQDMDMWIRIAIAGYELHVIEQPLTQYRVMENGSNMSSANIGNQATNIFEYLRTLRNYWQLASLQELLGIFPEIRVADGADDSLTLFYLARYAAQQPGFHHRLFALETMSRWGGNREAMSLAYKCHGFDFSQYRDFLSRGPIRVLLRLSIRHQINSLAMRLLPYAVYEKVKTYIKDRRAGHKKSGSSSNNAS